MVQVIMGVKGSGKTKKLVELVREALDKADGDVVVIEKERNLTYDIPYQARLVEAGRYPIVSYDFFKGALCGLHSGNYDITHIFVDNFYKLVEDKSPEALVEFMDWLKDFSETENIEFVITISMDADQCPESIKPLLISL